MYFYIADTQLTHHWLKAFKIRYSSQFILELQMGQEFNVGAALWDFARFDYNSDFKVEPFAE